MIRLLCNRCNTILGKPSYCPQCGCPEFRIEGLTSEELKEMNGRKKHETPLKQTRKPLLTRTPPQH